MALSFDVYWSFRSPYSYLAVGRLCDIEREYDVAVNMRPVYPIAIRDPGFFDKINPLWPPYLMRDTIRVAEMYGIPYSWPNPDPVVMDMATRNIPKEQPYIHRLTRLGIEACLQEKGLAFIDEVSTVIWTGTANWHEGDHLAQAAARAGLDLSDMDAAIEADPEKYEAIIQQNQEDQLKAGHWGVPTMVFENEPFFGQDHIDALLWRMGTKGLKKR